MNDRRRSAATTPAARPSTASKTNASSARRIVTGNRCFMISLTGLPPTAGFVGKLVLFGRMIEAGGTFAISLVVIGVLFSVVSLYYYARVVGAMFLVKPAGESATVRLPASSYIVLWAMAAGTIVFGLFPSGLMDVTKRALQDMITKI